MKKNAKQILLLPQFKKFISASKTGRRTQPSGKRITKETVEQYTMASRLLTEFELSTGKPLFITFINRASFRDQQKENRYWDAFYRQFRDFLYRDKKYYDAYAGAIFKIIKTFFNYLAKEKSLPVGNFHKRFRIPVSNIAPIVLTPQQLRFLVLDQQFDKSLSRHLKRTKDLFVFGCTVGLRYSDLMRLKLKNIHHSQEGALLSIITQKTTTEVQIPLPSYALSILKTYTSKYGSFLLPRLSATNFDLQIKQIIQLAGWIHPLPKIRFREGKPIEIKRKNGQSFRFCDHISAHTMRRTAITTLLMLGVPEMMVRRISGHAGGSKEFYRYVCLVQDYLNVEVRRAQQKLLTEI